MKRLLPVLVLLSFGCKKEEWSKKEIDSLLLEDRENKQLELMYLNEIKIAQENNDTEAYDFYFREYIKVPRLDIPEELKEHPDYFMGGDRVKY